LRKRNDSESRLKAVPARAHDEETKMQDAADNKKGYQDIQRGQDHENKKNESRAELTHDIWPTGDQAVSHHEELPKNTEHDA